MHTAHRRSHTSHYITSHHIISFRWTKYCDSYSMKIVKKANFGLLLALLGAARRPQSVKIAWDECRPYTQSADSGWWRHLTPTTFICIGWHWWHGHDEVALRQKPISRIRSMADVCVKTKILAVISIFEWDAIFDANSTRSDSGPVRTRPHAHSVQRQFIIICNKKNIKKNARECKRMAAGKSVSMVKRASWKL